MNRNSMNPSHLIYELEIMFKIHAKVKSEIDLMTLGWLLLLWWAHEISPNWYLFWLEDFKGRLSDFMFWWCNLGRHWGFVIGFGDNFSFIDFKTDEWKLNKALSIFDPYRASTCHHQSNFFRHHDNLTCSK